MADHHIGEGGDPVQGGGEDQAGVGDYDDPDAMIDPQPADIG